MNGPRVMCSGCTAVEVDLIQPFCESCSALVLEQLSVDPLAQAGVRCHGDACAAGQLPCPTPLACGLEAAQAIADLFKQAEAKRGEPFEPTFTNPMNNDAVTPNFVGIPVALLRALTNAQEATAAPVADPVSISLKAAFLLGLAALIDVMSTDVDLPAKARWSAWVQKEVDSIPDEITADYAIDSAIAFFNETGARN